MNAGLPLLLQVLILTISASAQDWQHCKPEGDFSFAELKDSVRRVTTSQVITSWDTKTLNRSGDLASLAILQTLTDKDMIFPATLDKVLYIVSQAFACPSGCVRAPSDRQPAITLLLLEHLYNNTNGDAQLKIDETRKVILQAVESGSLL